MKDNFNQNIYLTGNTPDDTQNDEPSAIRLYFLSGEKDFSFLILERKLKDMKDMKVDHFRMERIMKDFYHV